MVRVRVGSDLYTENPIVSRPAKPWYWKVRDAWYVTIAGKRIKLADGKASRNEAYRRFLEMGAEESKAVTARLTGKEVCDLYLAHAKANLKASTHDWYKTVLEPFGKTVASIDANEVKPKDVTRFLDMKRKVVWGKTTRANNITGIKRAWKWAKDEGHITLNHLAAMKRPRPLRRDQIPDDKEIRRLLERSSPALREFLTFLYETGCRPGEAAMIERRHVDLVNCEVRFRIGEDKTSLKTGRPRVIHLNDAAKAILEKLVSKGVAGQLFTNTRGKPWNRNSIRCAVARTRDRASLDERAVAYALRHHWATDALARGIPLATVAEMMGNSPEIVARVYSHLSDKKALLLQAANNVRPSSKDRAG